MPLLLTSLLLFRIDLTLGVSTLVAWVTRRSSKGPCPHATRRSWEEEAPPTRSLVTRPFLPFATLPLRGVVRLPTSSPPTFLRRIAPTQYHNSLPSISSSTSTSTSTRTRTIT